MNNKFLQLRIELDQAITFGKDEEARTIAQKGLDAAHTQGLPGEVEYFTAQFFILKEDFQGAIRHLNQAIYFNPHDGAAFNDKALCLVELGNFDAALENFDKGILAEPDYATVHHNKGWLLNKLGHYTAALDCFYACLKLEPERAVTYENIGNAYRNLGMVDKAKEAYQKALRFLPFGCDEIAGQIIALLEDSV